MGKVIVITGAGAGLGRALARRFAADGETVVLLGRTASKVETVAREIGGGAVALGCDVSSPASVRNAFAQIATTCSSIDVLINNAAVYDAFAIEDATDEQILSSVGANLTGAMLCIRSAVPLMRKGSHIISVSSEGVELPFPLMSVYQATKAGLERFTTAMHRELEPRGVRVSYVRAGAMKDADKVWDVAPEIARRFAEESAKAGVDLRGRAVSQFASVTQVFRSLIDLPEDVHALGVALFARHAEPGA
jgi:NAD(P)-dependent dehydrogenase (short-subunit alcohol dehydrogenase family)